MKVIATILTLILTVNLCRGQTIEKGCEFKNDTLRVIANECQTHHLIDSYYDIYGIKVSNYYQIIDSVTIFLNKDIISDKVIILSPRTQENREILPCEMSPRKRILLVLLSSFEKNRYEVDLINENVILNSYDYQDDPFSGLKKTKDGFKIVFEFGSIINCTYEFNFICKKSAILLRARYYRCFNKGSPNLTREKTQIFKGPENNLRNLNVNKFIHIPNLLDEKVK